ncbi:hypothetical protein VNO78_10445 [Psophocarpus tetragonolobus]|uniref:Uncharacterized protein n=1 Tax=Psophocarpus tetragonolobus TaxID=3891 RepID=A0AAN9XMR0_PSOTE
MGIGNSKLNADEGGKVVPTKLGPMLVARIDDFKNRMNGGEGEPTLSKKMLLKDVDLNSQSSPPSQELLSPFITTEKLSRVVPMPNSHCPNVEDNRPNNPAIQTPKAEDKKTAEPVNEEADADADADDSDSEEVGSFLCPGSPSFRIYCVEADNNNEEQYNPSTIAVHQKSRSADSVAIASSTTNSNKVLLESESTSKRKRNKKFGAIRTLLKVKSLYLPMCTCTGDDKNLIVT